MNSSGLKVGVGIAVAVLAVIALVQWSRGPGEAPVSDVATARQPMKQSDKVRQRLDQLQAARSLGSASNAAGAKGEMAARTSKRSVGQVPAAGRTPHAAVAAGGMPQEPAEADGDDFDADPDDLPALKKVVTQDPDPERRLAAVTMLGTSDDPEVIPTLAQALSDQDEEVRMAALQALSDFTDEPPVEAIESALNDSSPDIRFEALDVLSDIGGERVRQAIEKALNDPDEDVRSLAEGILDFEQLYEETPGEDAPAQTTPQMRGR